MACGVVTGGLMYFLQMRSPSVRMAASKALPAAAMFSGTCRSRRRASRRSQSSRGELGVDGQQRLAGLAGEADGELDDLLRAFLDLGVADELAGGEHLFEQHAKLDLGEAAAGLDVGEDAAEVVDAVGELGHLAEAGVDLVELVGDLAEGLGEPRLQRGVELLVDGLAHLFELFGVVFVQLGEAFFDGGAELVLQGGVAGHQLVELGC